MKIITADPTGLCFGVKRAITTVECALGEYGTVYAIGSPIHNPQEVARLGSMGLKVVRSETEVPDGAVAFIRAHGAAPSVFDALRLKNVHVIDGTCPFVRVVQKRAQELSKAGYHLLILGDEKHPEVQGIMAYATEKCTVITPGRNFLPSTISLSSDRIHKLGLVAQTTQEERLLADAARAVVGLADELRVYNTICHATVERQKAVAKLATEADGVIIIGGHNSANTGKLYRIAGASGCDVTWIEQASQLDDGWVRGHKVIGIAAGASTPDWLIKQLIDAINTIAGRQGDVNHE